MKDENNKFTSSEENTITPTNEINENQDLKEESELVENQNTSENNDLNEAIEKEPKNKIMKIIGKIFNWIGIGIIAILLIVVGWLSIDKYILKSKAPSIFGYSSFIVATGSMSGTIEEGDFIIVKKADEYKIGDIITFFPPDNKIPTTHRIIGYAGENFITKGDNNPVMDTIEVTPDMIVGKEVAIIPHVGVFFDWVKSGGGIIYIVLLVVILGIGIYIVKSV